MKQNSISLLDFDIYLTQLRTYMSTSRYKRALEEIKGNEMKFKRYPNYWKVYEIKILCYLKILTKKITYSHSDHFQILKIEKYLNKAEIEIENFNIFLDIYEQKNIKPYEVLLNLYMETLYLTALFYFHDKKLLECVNMLQMAETIFQTIEKLNLKIDKKALEIAQKIYLFLGALLIADCDFISAIQYQIKTVDLCFKSLLYFIDYGDPIDLRKFSKSRKHQIEKIIFNLFCAFYQRGVCEENFGNYPNTKYWFKQSKWCASNFLKFNNGELLQYITDVEAKTLAYHHVFEKTLQATRENEFLNNEKLERERLSKIQKQNMQLDDYEELEKKFGRTIKDIQKLKFNELDITTNNCSKNQELNEILYTTRVVNTIMKSKFRDLLMSLEKFDFHNLEKSTKSKIEKELKGIKEEVSQVESECIGRSSIRPNQSFGAIQFQEDDDIIRKRRSVRVTESNLSISPISTQRYLELPRKSILKNQTTSIFSQNTSTLSQNYHRKQTSTMNLQNVPKINIISAQTETSNEFIPISCLRKKEKLKINIPLPDEALEFVNDNKTNNQKSISHRKVNERNFHNSNISTIINSSILNTEKSRVSSPNQFRKSLKDKSIAKYNYNQYYHSKSYLSKMNHLDTVCSKEFSFQKKILENKFFQNIPHDFYCTDNIKPESIKKSLMVKTNMNSQSFLRKVENKVKRQNFQENKKRTTLEKEIIVSLNSRSLKKLTTLIKKSDSHKIKLRDEFKRKNSKSEFDGNEQNLMKLNLEHEMKIEKEIELIRNREKKNSMIQKRLTEYGKLKIFEKPKSLRNMEEFIKNSSQNENNKLE